jgi:RNA 3'-terminal phosphate cyclase
MTINKIRDGRKNGGLGRQHLTGINAAVQMVSGSKVRGNELQSKQVDLYL